MNSKNIFENNNNVNTFLIGVQKGGTTWLSSILRQHPDIFIPEKKEIHFFNKNYNFSKGEKWYHKHFELKKNKIILDCTPNYFWCNPTNSEIIQSRRNENVPKLIKSYAPNAKIILSLRNPVDRAVSAYYHHIRARRVSPTQTIIDVMDDFGILTMGYYFEQLMKWLKYFDLDNMLILIFEEDIKINKEETIKKLCDFLQIKRELSILNFPKAKMNQRGGSLYMRINYFNKYLGKAFNKLPNIISNSNIFPITVSIEQKQILKNEYEKDIKKLELFLNRSLPW